MPRNKRKKGVELTVEESLNVLKRTKEMVQKDENKQVKSEVKMKKKLKSMNQKHDKELLKEMEINRLYKHTKMPTQDSRKIHVG